MRILSPQGMDGQYWPINRLVGGFTDNDIQLPEMQRKYVWSKGQVLALIDSIYKGYPSGSMLLWETGKRPRVRAAATSKGSGRPSPGPSHILLDGHQRLASLAAVLAGMPVRSGGIRAEAEPVEAYFDMGHPEHPTAADTEGGWKGGDKGRKQGLGRSDRPIFRMKGRSAEGSAARASVAKLFKDDVASIFIEKKHRAVRPQLRQVPRKAQQAAQCGGHLSVPGADNRQRCHIRRGNRYSSPARLQGASMSWSDPVLGGWPQAGAARQCEETEPALNKAL